MKEEVKNYIDIKFNVFDEYFQVPEELAEDMASLRAKADAIGEECADSMEFESRFSSELVEEYNGMFAKCRPKSVKMTKEQKAASVKMAGELAYGTSNKGEMLKRAAKDVVTEAADTARVRGESVLIEKRREQMIEDGTFDDYTRAMNARDGAVAGVKLIGKLFGKKK